MTNNNQKLNTGASLSPEERAAMKQEFMAFMDANPVTTLRQGRVLSPYLIHILRVPAFAFVALFVVGGSAYAAERSLPNDLLYPVKVGIIEPLFIQAPARTPLAKAEASHALVVRRLEEAEALVDQNEMDTESAALIASAVEEHADVVQAYVAEAGRTGELSDALEVGTDLENVLEAHVEVLASVTDETSSGNEGITALIEDIALEADATEETGEALEEQAAEMVTEETEEYLGATVTEADVSIDALRAAIANAAPEAELVREAASLLERSEIAYDLGATYLSEGKKSAALFQLRDAFQNAEQGVILLESHQELIED